jgi:hypothetical protein
MGTHGGKWAHISYADTQEISSCSFQNPGLNGESNDLVQCNEAQCDHGKIDRVSNDGYMIKQTRSKDVQSDDRAYCKCQYGIISREYC